MARVSGIIRRCSPSRVRGLTTFLCFFVAAGLYFRINYSWRDPGSLFYDGHRAHEPRYSVFRQQQAEHYIHSPHEWERDSTGAVPEICVGIPTVARENGLSYFHRTVGSLLEGLTDEERQRVYVALLIVDTDPRRHPAYSSDWFRSVSDEALTYEDLDETQFKKLRELEDKGAYKDKSLLDYQFLLRRCLATQSPYIAMIEDDTLLQDGWLHRIEQALAEIELSNNPDFIYLRMFWTEVFLGWNREEWFQYLAWSLVVVSITHFAVRIFRRCFPRTEDYVATWSIPTIWAPLCIILYFAAGRLTVRPMTQGVVPMNNYGCCSQGLVFPRAKAEILLEWYQQFDEALVDMLTEKYADEHGEMRYAINPAVMQHVGMQSSKWIYGDEWNLIPEGWITTSHKLWNFAFEMHDPVDLRIEHRKAAASDEDGRRRTPRQT